jgi:hypothetical protein
MLTAEKPSTAKAYSRQFISLFGVDAAELVDEPLDGTEHRIQPGAFTLQHAGQIDAHRTNGCQQNQRRRWQIATSRWRTCQNFSGKSRVRVR